VHHCADDDAALEGALQHVRDKVQIVGMAFQVDAIDPTAGMEV